MWGESEKMNSQSESSRDRILSAAYRLLSEKGYANVSMRDIAKEADVALGLLTYHFYTKENLFTALATKLVSGCFDGAVNAIESGKDESERMHLLSDYFNNLLKNDKAAMKVLLDFSAQAMWNRSFKFQVTYLFDKLTELIKNEILTRNVRDESKILGKFTPETVAKVILGCFYGTAFRLFISNSDSDTDTDAVFELGDMLIDICRE